MTIPARGPAVARAVELRGRGCLASMGAVATWGRVRNGTVLTVVRVHGGTRGRVAPICGPRSTGRMRGTAICVPWSAVLAASGLGLAGIRLQAS